MQIVPSIVLTDIIKHYLFLDSNSSETKKLRLFSDGNTGIVFTLNNNLSLEINCKKLPNSFLYGQITQFKDIKLPNKTSLIIVVFQPTGVNQLLGIPAFELRDNIVNLDDIFGNKSKELEEKLIESLTIQEKLNFLNLFFTSLALNNLRRKEKIVSTSIDFIVKNKGLISNSQLVKHTGYTERHIERLFRDSIGVNPKNFANIIKLHIFLKQLKNKTEQSNLTQIAYMAGYVDQSHLIKEFKKFTGITPTAYKMEVNKLAINFIALPIS